MVVAAAETAAEATRRLVVGRACMLWGRAARGQAGKGEDWWQARGEAPCSQSREEDGRA